MSEEGGKEARKRNIVLLGRRRGVFLFVISNFLFTFFRVWSIKDLILSHVISVCW